MSKITKSSESITPKKIVVLFDGIVKAELNVAFMELYDPLFEKHGGDAMFSGTIHTTNGSRYVFSIERIVKSKSKKYIPEPEEIADNIADIRDKQNQRVEKDIIA